MISNNSRARWAILMGLLLNVAAWVSSPRSSIAAPGPKTKVATIKGDEVLQSPSVEGCRFASADGHEIACFESDGLMGSVSARVLVYGLRTGLELQRFPYFSMAGSDDLGPFVDKKVVSDANRYLRARGFGSEVTSISPSDGAITVIPQANKVRVALPGLVGASPLPNMPDDKRQCCVWTAATSHFVPASQRALVMLGSECQWTAEPSDEGKPCYDESYSYAHETGLDSWYPSAAVVVSLAPPSHDGAPAEDRRDWVAARLRAATASSSLETWKEYTFGAENLIDGQSRTSWQPRGKVSATNPTSFTLELAAPANLAGIAIANGFQRHDGLGDLFALNARIKKATVFLDDSKVGIPIAFEPTVRGWVEFSLPPQGSPTTKVTVVVESVHPGSKWKQLAVSEIKVFEGR
jgi:hypothetical protein